MLAAVRRFAKSPYAAALLVVLIISFAVFGIQDVFNGRVSDWVIKAGSRSVSGAEFKRNFDAFKAQAEQQAQRPLTVEELAAQGLDRAVLNDLAARESLSEWLHRAGIRPSDKLIAAELRKSTALFDPVTGKFDQAVYQQRLAENGLTPERYEGLLRDEIATNHFIAGLGGGFRAPRIYTALAAAYALEGRDISYITVTPQMVGAVPPPTDAELTAFMNENKAQLMRPEFRVLSVVRFTPTAMANAPVDPAKVQERFDFRKGSLSTPETRSLAVIPVTAQQGAAIAERLRKGEDPSVVAKAIGKDALILTDRPKTALPDRKIADAAFAMKAGEVAGPITGDLGAAVVKVIGVTPAVVATLEQHRAAIEAELRNEAGLEQVDKQTQAYEEAHNAGSNLLEAAAKAGATTFTVGPITKEGGALPGAPTAGLTPKILEVGFGLSSGGESDVTDAGQGEYIAVRVDRIIPPALPPLAEVRPELTQFYVQRKQLERMTQRAEALAERARKGEALSAIGASAGAAVQTAGGLDRLRAAQNQVLGQDILNQTFAAKAGTVFVARTPQFGMAVVKVDAVKPGPTAMIAQATAMQERPTSEAVFRALGEGARGEAVRKLKTKTDIERAKLAIGLDPATAADVKTAPQAPGAGK
jgi:peptidyl-prolyl cis-trans isomerase D